MNKGLKIILLVGAIFLTIIVGFYFFLHIALDGIFTGPSYTKDDLIKNYEERQEQIVEVKNYFESILPADAIVHIEFDNDSELGIFHVKADSVFQNNWRLEINSKKTDSLLRQLGWTTKELKTLKSKLDSANCISISSRKPVTIGWQRSGMGMFKYNLFDRKLTDSLIDRYNDGCMYIYYKENVVLEYGGGAIGPQCFPGYKPREKNAAANNV